MTIQRSKSVNPQQEPMQAEAPTVDDVSALPKSAEAEIALGLKRLYGQMLAEPMPEKFMGLLQQLAKSDPKCQERPKEEDK